MKIYIAFFILFIANFSQAENPLQKLGKSLIASKPQHIQDAFNQKLKWNDDLAFYLIENEDAEISLLGYQYSMPQYQAFFSLSEVVDKYSLSDIANDINEMVKKDQLSPYGLSLALSLCTKDIKPYDGNQCDLDLIFQKQKKITPDNAFNYIYPIQSAVDKKDYKKLKSLIKQMSKCKYINTYNYTHKNLESLIDAFYLTHPFEEVYLRHEKKQLMENKSFNEVEKLKLLESMENNILLSEKISFELAIAFPPLRPITDTCKNKKRLTKLCLKISNIMISSTDIVTTIIGHVIKTDILKRIKSKKYKKAQSANLKYRNQFECLSEINQNANVIDVFYDDDYYIRSKTQREKGSFASLIKQAELNYQKGTKAGNKDLMNPKDCLK